MPEILENTSKGDIRKIRHYFDQKIGKWYFSIVDVIGILTNSSDPRNYWKVLKNRLKKTNNQLVTNCNQLKMMAKDGKYYLTDVADSETMIGIIESIPRASVEALKILIKEIEENSLGTSEQAELPDGGAELLVDGYETDTSIVIEAMVAGVFLPDISISVFPRKIIVSGKRNMEEHSSGGDSNEYLYQELMWTNFSRTILLPSPVKTENFERREKRGHLQIKLEKV